MSVKQRELSPFELGIENVDMQAVVGTEYEPALVLDVRQFFVFTAVINVTAVGPAVGAAQFSVKVFSIDKTTVLFEVILATGISTITSGTPVSTIVFGAGVTTALQGSGTIGTSADVFKLGQFIKPVLEVETQADGTSSVASVTLLEGD